MTDLEALAETTCQKLLGARELKAICRHRGFNPPAGDKAVVASFVAPRLLEPSGVAEAMGSLTDPWLVVLHMIAMAKEPPGLGDLRPIIQPGRRVYGVDYHALFRKLAEGLLSRGVVLVEDRQGHTHHRRSRFERFAFRLPETHRALLPPFPVPTRSLGDNARARDAVRFCREALRKAAGEKSARSNGLLEQVARAISFEDGKLQLSKAALPDLATFLPRVRSVWASGGLSKSNKRKAAFHAAEHILGHLPTGEGVTVQDLRAALSRIGMGVEQAVLTRFCEDGCEVGLLARAGERSRRLYAAVPGIAAVQENDELVFTATEDAVRVDLEQTGLGSLLELAAISRVEPAGRHLRVEPDLVLLGRASDRLESFSSLKQVRRRCPAFDEAIEHVRSQHGRVILHEGLLIMRIDDLGLRTLLAHELGAAFRSLGGPYLAAPRAFLSQIEKLARKEGFAPRRVS